MEVHNVLGPGYPEKICEEAFVRELKARGIHYDRQKLTEVIYKGEKIGDFRVDVVIENKVVVELKAVSELSEVFDAQILSYLAATGLRLGILINFGRKRLKYRQVVN